MAINHYYGTDGPTIEAIESPQDLYEVLDTLHTMVIGSMEEAKPNVDGFMLRVLEQAMSQLMEKYEDITV
jgi:hypothetical protein